MKKIDYHFSTTSVSYYLDAPFTLINELVKPEKVVIITDENIHRLHAAKLEGYKTIVVPPGEEYKQQATVDNIVQQLIALEADRKFFLIGVGGGVITDITGYVAAIYMRGVSVGFVPTTILAQVDAAIGGKNGIDIGIYKNLVGTIRQPDFILFDYSFLETLPQEQWVNGFAEIIKHACIKDASLFDFLEQHSLPAFQQSRQLLADLIERNVAIKSTVVTQDEFEQGDRKLLNFGHTLGHAIENEYSLLHGHAISIGMVAAAAISEKVSSFSYKEKLVSLLNNYHLPTVFDFDKEKAFAILKMDKKREGDAMNFVLLNKIGEAVVKAIPLKQLEQIVQAL